MIKFKDLIIESRIQGQTIKLYRGDSTPIEHFDMRKTDKNALFGQGIYLTDNPEIADSYKSKGDGSQIYNSTVNWKNDTPSTSQDAVREYGDWKYRELYGEVGKPEPNLPMKINGAAWNAFYKRYDAWYDSIRKTPEYHAIVDPIIQNPNQFLITKTGSSSGKQEDNWSIVDLSKNKGVVVAFNVPVDWVNNCYDCEKEMSDELKKFLVQLSGVGSRPAKNLKERTRLSNSNFSDYIGTVSLGWFCYNNQYSLWDWSATTWKAFREYFIGKGISGLKYQGGNYVNNGLGNEHNAYVFWNIPALNKMREVAIK